MGFIASSNRIKGIGSSNKGTEHWFAQRVTALALVPLLALVVNLLLGVVSSDGRVTSIFSSPFNSIVILLFILTSLYHGLLGMNVVIEDYIHNKCFRIFLTIILKLFTILTAFTLFFAVISFNLLGI